MSEVRTRFRDRVLVDTLFENPVDRYQVRAQRRNVIILLLVVVIVVAVIIWRSRS
jgi:hypothetical protein